MSDEALSLRLVGYYDCAGHGFAMPLYGQYEGANTLYIAIPKFAGDHCSTIAGFEPVNVDVQQRLPHGESIPVAVGESWLDVFLWNDNVYAGTPAQLWKELEPVHGDVESRAPLSLLELAIHADSADIARIAPVAFDFVLQRFGDESARRWRRQMVRQFLVTEVRRSLAAIGIDSLDFLDVSVIERAIGRLSFQIPSAMSDALVDNEAFGSALSRLDQICGLLGAKIAAEPSIGPAEVETDDRPEDAPPPPSARSPETGHSLATAGTLIIAGGRRARDIVSHLRRKGDDPEFPVNGDRHLAATTAEFARLQAHIGPLARVILILYDEEDRETDALLRNLSAFIGQQVGTGSLVLLAPALPSMRPSRLFEVGARLPEIVHLCHAVLDTSIARSPFWWGKAKRSFDRRISDIIELAITTCRSTVVRRELSERRMDELLPVLAVGTIEVAPDGARSIEGSVGLKLGSEASWVSSDPKRNDPTILFSLRINPHEIDNYTVDGQIVVEGRRRENRFPEFAGRVLAPLFSRRLSTFGREHRLEQLPEMPVAIVRSLRAPGHSSGYAISDGELGTSNLALLGETPTLEAIEKARDHGWSIVRYTDIKTLRKLAEDEQRPVTFPDEIDIGPIQSHPINRQLAARGADQRDIVRISYDVLSEWLDGLPDADRHMARGRARPLRSASQLHGDRDNDHLLMRDYVLGDDPSAEMLRRLLATSGKANIAVRPKKRFLDLQKCWTPPSPGFQRYAMVDGAIPVILIELQEDEVPVEDLFIIDGDLAVPALFRSRVFGVWARATLPAASSWMSRFSIANTFGGFPIVSPFRVVGQEGSLAALVVEQAPSEMAELTRQVSQHVERMLASHPSGSWKEAHRVTDELPAMRQLNAMILRIYGLPEDADDITILRRLQRMNAETD